MRHTGLKITAYKRSTYEALVAFWTARGLNLRTGGDDSPSALANIHKRNPEGFVLIVDEQDKIVATCVALFDGLGGLLTHLAVHPDFRGEKGLARALIENAHESMFARGARYMYLFVRGVRATSA